MKQLQLGLRVCSHLASAFAFIGSFGLSTKEPIQSYFVRRCWHLCTVLLATGLDIETLYLV